MLKKRVSSESCDAASYSALDLKNSLTQDVYIRAHSTLEYIDFINGEILPIAHGGSYGKTED